MNEKPIHILMVEDNEAHAELVRRALECDGQECRLTVAGTLEKALVHLEASAPDLVIADLLLPDGTGMELLPAEEKDRRFPLIVMTSHGDEQVAVEAIKSGALDYVVKSDVTMTDMPRIVKRALREWALINEHHQAEAALRESEARYRALSENMSNGVVIYRAIDEGMDFVIVEFNKAAEEIEKIKRDSIIGKSVLDVFPEVRDFGLFEVLQRVWATGNPEHYPVKMYKDERIVGWRKNFVYKLPSGEIVVLCTDETKRKKAEEALRLEKDNLINILDSMEDGVYVVNQEYDIEYINPSLKREFGPFEGKKCHEYFHDWKEACPWCTTKDVFSGKTVRWEWPASLNHKTYDFIATPLKNPDGSVSKLGILRDVTERKRTEEELRRANRKIIKQQKSVIEEERLKVLFQMAGATAHELNQPLMTLLGGIDLMRINKGNPEKLARHSAMIEDAGQRISDIVKKIQTIRHYETKPYLDKSTIINLDQKIHILSVQNSDEDFRKVKTATKDRSRITWTRVGKIHQGMELLEEGEFDMVLLDYLLPDGNAQDFLRSMENRGSETPVVVVISAQGDEMAAAQVIQAGVYDYITKDKLNDKSISQIIDNTLEKAFLKKEISAEREMMAEMTNRDEMTGLYNRSYFMEALSREVARAKRYESDMVLCLMDIDHFKRVNDTYGQNAGNLVLIETGKMLQNSLRQSDLVCRYGYEEFAAILPNTDLVKARIVCERFRKSIAAHQFRFNASKVRLTMSMGLASCRDEKAQSPSRLIQMSDQALCQAKEAGRNRVVELS